MANKKPYYKLVLDDLKKGDVFYFKGKRFVIKSKGLKSCEAVDGDTHTVHRLPTSLVVEIEDAAEVIHRLYKERMALR